MCNAYNHPPGCNCGWGGGNYGSRSSNRNIYLNYVNNEIQKPEIKKVELKVYTKNFGGLKKTVVTFENGYEILEEKLRSETKPCKCSYCGEEVFFYQNERGSKVFFENLGIPWIKHECFEYLEAKKFKNK